MVALRSARLEALLGSRLEHVQYPKLMTLISNQVAEALDLDFKPLSSPCLSLALRDLIIAQCRLQCHQIGQ